MPTTPLSSSISSILQSDSTAALAALMVIANAHGELFSWAAQVIREAAPAGASTNAQPEPQPLAKRNGAEPLWRAEAEKGWRDQAEGLRERWERDELPRA